MTAFEHVTVLRAETVACVEPRATGIYADCTLGGGGHSELLLESTEPTGRLVAIDRDLEALAAARVRLERFGSRVQFVHARFGDLAQVLAELGLEALDGIVADLGVSSPQLDVDARGFSFMRTGPLDMRMDTSRGETALELIERLSDEDLADVLYQFGEERRSRAIARSIRAAHREGRLETTDDLVRAVRRVLGPKKGRIDPATRTFQALRIAVNGELEELRLLLDEAPRLLNPGGVIAIISFHSLEDRMVKHAFRDDARLEVLTKKPLVASEEEAEKNPRARSAKLRAARRRTEVLS